MNAKKHTPHTERQLRELEAALVEEKRALDAAANARLTLACCTPPGRHRRERMPSPRGLRVHETCCQNHWIYNIS